MYVHKLKQFLKVKTQLSNLDKVREPCFHNNETLLEDASKPLVIISLYMFLLII